MGSNERTHTALYALAAGSIILGAMWWHFQRRQARSARSFVASLAEALNGEEGTLWLNLGYWDGKPRTYAKAAEALAIRVADATRLGEISDARVLDVGCGMGESMLLWRKQYGASADSAGINKSEAEVSEAHGRGIHQVACADATSIPFEDSAFDRVLAVDSAYHFLTRERFLFEASRVLKVGGKFGAADIIAADSKTRNGPWFWKRRLVCSLVGIPIKNVYGAAQYRSLLESAGLSRNIQLVDVTENVTSRFARGDWSRSSAVRLVAKILGIMMESADLRFIVVSAEKKS